MECPTEVLLVDDNPADLELTRDILAQGGQVTRVRCALNGEDALNIAREQPPPDLVLHDLNLPAKDGRAVLAEIKADVQLRHIPVVIFTTSQAPHDVEQTYQLGANCFVSKPGNLHDFEAAVTAVEQFWLKVARLPRQG